MNNIMLDLEALDPSAGGVLVSIGAVYFDFEQGLGDELYVELSQEGVKEQIEQYGRTISVRCLYWWMQQSDGARRVFKENMGQTHFIDALRQFKDFYQLGGKPKLWGNGADFDNVFLKNCYDSVGMKLPWSFRNNRCYRTVKNMFGNRAKLERIGSHHNALDDAKTQALHLIKMMEGVHVNE